MSKLVSFNECGSDGRVFQLEALKEKFQLKFDKDDRGCFFVDVQLKGVKEKIQVKITFVILGRQYVVLTESQIVYSAVNLGETRLNALSDELCGLLYTDDSLFLGQLETDGALVYGEHAVANIVARHSSNRAISYYVRKIAWKDMELLLEDKVITEYGQNKEKLNRRIFFYDGMLLIRKADERTEARESALKSGDLKGFFSSVYDSNLMVDDNHQVYETVPVYDPENIRLLTLVRRDGYSTVKVKDVFHTNTVNYSRGLTYSEALVQITENFPDEKHDLHAQPSYPVLGEEVTIFSDRIVGKKISCFEPGQWVELVDNRGNHRLANGLYGQVKEQIGISLTIVWENQYSAGYNDTVSYYQVKPITSPLVEYDKPKFVRFRHFRYPESIGDLYVGYGLVRKRTERFSLVIPLTQHSSELFGLFVSDREKTDSMAQYGMQEPFLLVPNDSVYIVQDARVKEYVTEYAYDEKHVTFKRLVSLMLKGSIPSIDYNADTFATRLTLLVGQVSYEEIISKLSTLLYNSSANYNRRIDLTTQHFEGWLETVEGEFRSSGLAINCIEQEIMEALEEQFDFTDLTFEDINDEGDLVYIGHQGDPRVEQRKFQISVAFDPIYDSADLRYCLLDVPGTQPLFTGQLFL